MAYSPDTANQAYSALNHGIVADGSTDDTAAWNALFALILTNGGGTAYLAPGRTSLCSGALTPMPFIGATTNQPSLRITGAGPSGPGDTALTRVGAGILDLRYNGENAVLTITATGGTYTLNYNGSATASINFNDVAATIQTRLQATPSGGSLTVTGTNPFTITGSGLPLSATTTSLTGGTATITNNAVAKIDTRNHGQLEIDHLTLTSGGTDDYPFFQTTNTAVYGHDLMIQGHTANSGTGCVQDGFNLGGLIVNVSTGAAGNSDAIFQGYSTRFERVFFENIRIGFNARIACNAVVFNQCVFSSSCGGDTTHGAFTTGSASLSAAGNTFTDNLIEVGHYPYAFVFGTNSFNNTGIGNGLWDASGTSIATCSDAAGNTTNRFTGTYSSITGDAPDTMSVTRILTTGTFTPCVNGSYQIECLGGGGQGGGGSGNATGGGGGGGGSGTTIAQVQTLVSGTSYTGTVGAGGTGSGGGGASGANGTGGTAGGTTTFAGPTNLVATGGGNGQGGQITGSTGAGGPGPLNLSGTTAQYGSGWGGGCIANVVGIGATGGIGLAGGGGGGGGIVGGGKGGGGGGAGGYASGAAAAGTQGASATTAGANGANAAANTGAGGGGAGCGDANTGGTGGSGGSGFIRITGPYPAY